MSLLILDHSVQWLKMKNSHHTLNHQEILLLDKLNFDRGIVQELKQYFPSIIHQIQIFEEWEAISEIYVTGIYFDSSDFDECLLFSDGQYQAIQEQISEKGYQLFDFIQRPALIRGKHTLDIIRVLKTAAANAGHSNDAIVKQLKVWRQRADFDIVSATGQGFVLYFNTLPKDKPTFIAEASGFCMDIYNVLQDLDILEVLLEQEIESNMILAGMSPKERQILLIKYLERYQKLEFFWD